MAFIFVALSLAGVFSVTSGVSLKTTITELKCPDDSATRINWLYPDPNDAPQGYFSCYNKIPMKGRCDFHLDEANGKCFGEPIPLRCPVDWKSRIGWKYANLNDVPKGYYECNHGSELEGFEDYGIPEYGRCDFYLDVPNGRCYEPVDPIDPEPTGTMDLSHLMYK